MLGVDVLGVSLVLCHDMWIVLHADYASVPEGTCL